MENNFETASENRSSENRFKTSGYFLDQVRFIEIKGRMLKYIQVYSFSELGLKKVTDTIKSLRRMSISEIDLFKSGCLGRCDHLFCMDPFFVVMYAELINEYSYITECTRQEAYEHFKNLEWDKILALLDGKISQRHCLFYRDGYRVHINDQAEAAKAGIILIDDFSLDSFRQIAKLDEERKNQE